MSNPAKKIETPCIDMCALNSDRVCKGCGRTINEISGWRNMSDDQREAVRGRLQRERSVYMSYPVSA